MSLQIRLRLELDIDAQKVLKISLDRKAAKNDVYIAMHMAFTDPHFKGFYLS